MSQVGSLEVRWANGSVLSAEQPFGDAVPVVPLYPLLAALDNAYHPQAHFEAHPIDYLVERLGVTQEQWDAFRRWEASR